MTKLLLALATTVALVGPAHATEDFCAVVKPNRDGWLALRWAPGAQYTEIARLHPGTFLFADTATCQERKLEPGFVCDPKHKWIHVMSVPRLDGYRDPQRERTRGWVHGSYVQSFLCFEDQAEAGEKDHQRPTLPKPETGWSK
jgi:hypothetical protein